MNCKHCHKPIVLVPSAAERAAKDTTGKSALYYTNLFEYHTACSLKLREKSMQKTFDTQKEHIR